MDHDPADLVTVYDTSDPALVPVIKSLLQGADIPFLVQGDEAVAMLPVGEISGPFSRSGLAARFMVRSEDAEAAAELLAELE
jgi:hypothetical protein